MSSRKQINRRIKAARMEAHAHANSTVDRASEDTVPKQKHNTNGREFINEPMEVDICANEPGSSAFNNQENVYPHNNVRTSSQCDESADDKFLTDDYFDYNCVDEFNNYALDEEAFVQFGDRLIRLDGIADEVKNEIDASYAEIGHLDNEASALVAEVRDCCLKHLKNVTHSFLNDILPVLRKHTGEPFPLDARTFLKTPRHTQVDEMDGGHYIHFGVENAVKQISKKYKERGIEFQEIKLIINIDGAPTGHSNEEGLWIIMAADTILRDVYVIGIHSGKKKPADSNVLLKKFSQEMTEGSINGFTIDGENIKVILDRLVCDVPAKSYVLKVRGHTGYSSCTKCKIVGTPLINCISFACDVDNLPELRDDASFIRGDYKGTYQVGPQSELTILKDIPRFNPVSSVPCDPMHLLGGIMKKILNLLLNGPPGIRLSPDKKDILSQRLLAAKKCTPSEFNRQCTIHQTKGTGGWKSQQYREFAHYQGQVVLKGVMSQQQYKNFMMFSRAITILDDPMSTEEDIDYAGELLKNFVEEFGLIYGHRYVSHNVHNLLHLADDVRKYGQLDNFSAYIFESKIAVLKKYVRGGHKVLQQLARRFAEAEFYSAKQDIQENKIKFSQLHSSGPTVQDNCNAQFSQINISGYQIQCYNIKNDCILMKNSDDTAVIVQCYNFVLRNEIYYVVGCELEILGSLYNFSEHFESTSHDIYVVRNPETVGEILLKEWPCYQICAKLFKVPYLQNLVVIPLIHSKITY